MLVAAFGSGWVPIVVAAVLLRGSPPNGLDQPAEAAVGSRPVSSAVVSPDTSRPGGRTDVPWVEVVDAQGRVTRRTLCQTRCLMGVDCDPSRQSGESRWSDRRVIPWELFAQGEYVGPYRDLHVPEYRMRVDDELEFVYRLTRVESNHPYELNVGDQVRVESMTDPTLDRELVIQPDGMITLRMLGQVRAARRTVTELRDDLEEQYQKYYKVPAITVTPLQVNTRLEDLRAAVDSRFGQTGGQAQQSRVTPEGTIQLPGIGSVIAQGLTLDELKQEIDERYAQLVDGIGVTPRLLRRAPRFVYVVGEVRQPGRYTLEAPTTSMQAIALAGGWNNGGNLRHIVVFRRTDDWRLIATKLDLRGALLGERPCPADEVWLRDSDIVVVPKSPLLRTNDFIELFFTRGIYGVVPVQGVSIGFQKLTSL
jgi:polysaccharide biosynthesis/export protein